MTFVYAILSTLVDGMNGIAYDAAKEESAQTGSNDKKGRR